MTPFSIKLERPHLMCAFMVWAMATSPLVAAENAKTYRAEIPLGTWPGWDFNPEPNAPKPAPEQFEIVTTDGKSARTFSGKIVGLKSMDGIQVGLESLIGIPWTNDDLYQWEKVAPDGTFSITDAHHRDADKAICVRGPDTAWTFLRFNFAPNHGAKNIVLHAAPCKKVNISAAGDGKGAVPFWLEIFDAYSQTDDHGNWLNRQRLGTYESDDKGNLTVVLPIGQVALFLHSEGWASHYQIVDTREADGYVFILRPGGELKLRLLDKEGKPKPGVAVNWKNPAAPLSYWEFKTDANGEFTGHDLVPGMFQINVPGSGLSKVAVERNALTSVVFQDGKGSVITASRSTPPAK